MLTERGTSAVQIKIREKIHRDQDATYRVFNVILCHNCENMSEGLMLKNSFSLLHKNGTYSEYQMRKGESLFQMKMTHLKGLSR